MSKTTVRQYWKDVFLPWFEQLILYLITRFTDNYTCCDKRIENWKVIISRVTWERKMPGLDLANILVAFQTAYVKSLCILTAVLLGPWVGVQIMFYSNHPPGKSLPVYNLAVLILYFKRLEPNNNNVLHFY